MVDVTANSAIVGGVFLSLVTVLGFGAKKVYQLVTRRAPDQDLIDAVTALLDNPNIGHVVNYNSGLWRLFLHDGDKSIGDVGHRVRLVLEVWNTDDGAAERNIVSAKHSPDTAAMPVKSAALKRKILAICEKNRVRYVNDTFSELIAAHKKGQSNG